jgi:hypothetical protein
MLRNILHFTASKAETRNSKNAQNLFNVTGPEKKKTLGFQFCYTHQA